MTRPCKSPRLLKFLLSVSRENEVEITATTEITKSVIQEETHLGGPSRYGFNLDRRPVHGADSLRMGEFRFVKFPCECVVYEELHIYRALGEKPRG